MLAVVVLTKNSERTISYTLSSLVESSYVPKEVIIVDGGSKDSTLKIVRDFYDKLNIKIIYDERKGLGYARDIGWKETNRDIKYVAMVDSDVVVDKTFFEDALQILEKDEKLGALGAKLKPECDEKGILAKFQTKNLSIHLHWKESPYPKEVIATHTACTIFRKSALEEVGGFDHYFKLAKEDSDISFRLRKAGYRLSYLDHYVKHLETGKRFWKINFRYGRSYVHISRKHPVEGKLWTKKNIIFSLSLILFPSEFLVWFYYFLRYMQLEDVTFSEAFVLSLVETVRQIVRTAGMLYELLFFYQFKKKSEML
ncbi:MAG: glycosyltransferase [Thermoproteota archaeon]|nr:glycosyltransferase [Candidatus Brockarchaeota archaeon]